MNRVSRHKTVCGKMPQTSVQGRIHRVSSVLTLFMIHAVPDH